MHLLLGQYFNMALVTTETIIFATPERVWKIFKDLIRRGNGHQSWLQVETNKAPGQHIQVAVKRSKNRVHTFSPMLLIDEEDKEFRWVGKLGCLLVVGEHYFQLEPCLGGRATRFVNEEEFYGILVPLFKHKFHKSRHCFMEFNLKLKEMCEHPGETIPSLPSPITAGPVAQACLF
ncbi:hypothetical protein CEUSTIGMA_g11144.t1 [Chlamydomonas eustigma]|uniref:Uncharacterized protein n=1 Tax=Chlamydomonas eustigma TaxID=1157962 RepID=A0A250XLB8_9CHLO|nr:hypothetical protein CEUSTIGMA_g11144.t1 [Chlamydomonas eustigma]|eukprot:GAX83719.1 hypothetical protein CEUSTIGMA_g11144.t1 [Chlamydomonas eustigma]